MLLLSGLHDSKQYREDLLVLVINISLKLNLRFIKQWLIRTALICNHLLVFINHPGLVLIIGHYLLVLIHLNIVKKNV